MGTSVITPSSLAPTGRPPRTRSKLAFLCRLAALVPCLSYTPPRVLLCQLSCCRLARAFCSLVSRFLLMFFVAFVFLPLYLPLSTPASVWLLLFVFCQVHVDAVWHPPCSSLQISGRETRLLVCERLLSHPFFLHPELYFFFFLALFVLLASRLVRLRDKQPVKEHSLCTVAYLQ